jgi:hypothetical protein
MITVFLAPLPGTDNLDDYVKKYQQWDAILPCSSPKGAPLLQDGEDLSPLASIFSTFEAHD